MIEIIPIEKSEFWDKVVLSFTNYDVYYLSGYVKAFQIHGAGEPLLIYYKSDDLRGICVLMKRDISQDNRFKSFLPENTYFDVVTPYGYGGFVFEGDMSIKNINRFSEKYIEILNSENIISTFYRFHPQLGNASYLRSIIDVVELGRTIVLDLDSETIIWNNISSKNRNAIRGAQKKEVIIKHGKSKDLFEHFIEIYNSTMAKDKADSYYFFGLDFYESLRTDLKDNFEIFFAEHFGKIVAIAIILYANGRLHYHLSGSIFEYRHLSPSNLLLFEVALWGSKNGFKTFHLGGGLGSGEDNLFKFKKAFNRNSGLQFSVGKEICNLEKYNYLVQLRKEKSFEFKTDSSFFPLYRAQ